MCNQENKNRNSAKLYDQLWCVVDTTRDTRTVGQTYSRPLVIARFHKRHTHPTHSAVCLSITADSACAAETLIVYIRLHVKGSLIWAKVSIWFVVTEPPLNAVSFCSIYSGHCQCAYWGQCMVWFFKDTHPKLWHKSFILLLDSARGQLL